MQWGPSHYPSFGDTYSRFKQASNFKWLQSQLQRPKPHKAIIHLQHTHAGKPACFHCKWLQSQLQRLQSHIEQNHAGKPANFKLPMATLRLPSHLEQIHVGMPTSFGYKANMQLQSFPQLPSHQELIHASKQACFNLPTSDQSGTMASLPEMTSFHSKGGISCHMEWGHLG